MSLEKELELVLAEGRLHALFQPIIACRESALFGYEALIRGPSDSPLHSPLNLFDAAGRYDRLVELDLLCRKIAIAQFGRLGLPGQLFLNVTPATVAASEFRSGETARFIEQAGIAPSRVVIELTEQFPIHDYDVVRTAVDHYRSMGFSIAIDDLGAGHSSLRHWAELRPDYVKIDKHFVQGLDQDQGKRQFLRSILEMSKDLGGRVIAEGIETLEEYRNLWSMGLELGQGYYFARPQAVPPRSFSHLLPANGHTGLGQKARFTESVSGLVRPAPAVAPATPAEEVAALFEQLPALRSVPVVDAGVPVGQIRRHQLMDAFASRYGRALYARRSAAQVALLKPIVVSQEMPVEQLSQKLTESGDLAGDEDILVVDTAGQFVGVCTLMDLLRKITELQIRNARYANPLSGLPGNVPVNERMEELLCAGSRFAVAYCDLDNFKAFNDSYGYSRGDEVIVQLARLLQDQTAAGVDFVGHIGGDDFLIIFQSSDWPERCQRILTAFAALAPWFYEPDHRADGGILSRDRRGQATFFPIMSISVAVVPVWPEEFHSRHEISGVISEIKAQAKRIPGNSLFVDRRHHENGAPSQILDLQWDAAAANEGAK